MHSAGELTPIHLLTREAFAEYFRHIAPGGAVAVHVTNKHLDLAPVVKLIAGERRAHALPADPRQQQRGREKNLQRELHG